MMQILSLLKYWRVGGIVLLVAAFLISAQLAKSRGDRLEAVQMTLDAERQKFQAQIKTIEKERQNEKERNIFRRKQAGKIRMAQSQPVSFDDNLRAVYEQLREREQDRIAG